MIIRGRYLLVVLSVGAMLTASGCLSGDDRTANQGGGSLISAASKLLAHNIGDLTADEWQILGDNVPTLAAQFNVDLHGIEIPTLSDEQAAVIVEFLDAHNMVTIEEFEAAINSGELGVDDIPPELVELIPPDIYARL